MRPHEASIVAKRVFDAFPEASANAGTRAEYERFLRQFDRDTGDAIVTRVIARYEWLPKIRHLGLVADELAGDGAFATLKDRILETARWAVGSTDRRVTGMTIREFLTGERKLVKSDLEKAWDPRAKASLELRLAALDAILAETDERGGHRDAGDPHQEQLTKGAP